MRNLVLVVVSAAAMAIAVARGAEPQTLPSSGKRAALAMKPDVELKPASNDTLDRVQKKLHAIRSIEGEFDQEVFLAGLKVSRHFSGHFAVKEPNRIIWIVDTPSPGGGIRVLGDELLLWDPSSQTTQRINLADNATFKSIAQQSRDWTGGNFKALSESYNVFVVSETPMSLRFVPKPGTGLAGIFKNVEATLDADMISVAQIIYRQPSGDMTTVNFKGCQVNQPIKPRTWDMPPRK